MCAEARSQRPDPLGPALAGDLNDSIKPLQIGDTIPEYLWHLPLQVVNQPEKKETITLNDYRGKLIILDFWGTYCTTCIFNMPYLHGLANKSGGALAVLPVTPEKRDYVARFLNNNARLKTLSISSIVQDQTLRHTFPTQTLPHLVLIDQHGRIRTITQAEYLNDSLIAKLAAGSQDVYIPLKREGLSRPLMDVASAYSDTRINGNVYYSAVSGFIDGITHTMKRSVDSAQRLMHYTVTNTSVAKLYTTALGSPLPLDPKRRILEAALPHRYVFVAKHYWDIDQRRSNFYTYECVMPIGMAKKDQLAKMRIDLDAYLGLNGRIAPRTVRCLALVKTNGSTEFAARETGERQIVVEGKMDSRFFDKISQMGALPNGVDTYIRNGKFADMVGLLNRITAEPLPVILNETGYDGRFNLDFPTPHGATLDAINTMLQAKGLALQWVDREMDMFVLTETGFPHEGQSPTLSDIGYTYSSTQTQ
ncbi:TlpA family protein disulfide reductase [Parapedobacter tibetensis]|uniref:TlpA family protein disulfide reductase n=1 Tax=Parapedobacter tibetensis TaxID=2972951 RepID=UPI00214D82D9|nr:TlpA disulfide reductase family protein [Parapedobacter tibetensis]